MTGHGSLVRLLRVVLSVLVTGAVAYTVVRNWPAVAHNLQRVAPATLVLAFVLALLAPIFTLFGWRVLMADLGSSVPVPPAAGIFFVGQLGKYVPGSVWSVLAQAEMGTRLHIPRRRTAVVGLISIGMAAITGLVVGLPALPFLLRRQSGLAVWGSLLLVLPLVVVLVWPPLLNALVALGLRMLRREALERSLSARSILVTAGLFTLAWVASGAQLWVLTRAVAAPGTGQAHLAYVSVCGFALASSLGMFSVLLPAGVGVREGLLAVALAPSLPLGATAAVVVLSRFIVTLVDLVCAAAGWVWARSHHLVSTRAELKRRAGLDPAVVEQIEEEGSSA